MESGHYLKTELEIITVNDLDGELPEEIQGRNFLREKTFNSELNSLVNKIFNNEKLSEEPVNLYKEFDALEKNSILLKYEKLIYKLKHFEDLNSISSLYNPFDTDINVYDDIDDIADYIKAGLIQGGVSKYQLLKYNFNDKAYRSDINFLDSSYSADMYFSIDDPLLSKIQKDSKGFILSADLINSDPFFSKKFLNRDADDLSSRSFYIIKITSLFNDPINDKIIRKSINSFEEFLSPLLLLELETGNKIKPDDIFRTLKETAALPLMLYFLKNSIKFTVKSFSYEDILLMIELFIKSAVDSRLKSYIITLQDFSIKNNIFIFKYFLSKLRRILNRNSIILRISINKAIFITTSSDLDEINNIKNRINSESNIIEIQSVDYNEYLISKEFVNLFL